MPAHPVRMHHDASMRHASVIGRPACVDELVSVSTPELAAGGSAALAVAALVFAVLERRSRTRWSTEPLARCVVGDTYRASSIVSRYRTRAPGSVRAVAAACIVFACAMIPSAVSAWVAFGGYGGFITCAIVASIATAYAGGALLARSTNAHETVRVIAVSCASFFLMLCVAALRHARDAPACVQFGPVFSIEAAAFVIAAAFGPIGVWLLIVQSMYARSFRASA
jgi:hypothetical protein